MADDSIFQGEIDPEIAALLGTDVSAVPEDEAIPELEDGFDDPFAEADPSGAEDGEKGEAGPDLSAGGFPEITKKLEAAPHNAFNDPAYYKTALSNEAASAQRLHGLLQKFLNTKDPKDRGLFRQQIIPVFWDFLLGIARKTPGSLPLPKKYLLRFGILHPTFLDPETRTFFAKIVVENELSQPIYYLDEWLRGIGTGTIKPSTTDEVQPVKSGGGQIQFQQLLEKAQGKMDGSRTLLRAKSDERTSLEQALMERVRTIFEHIPEDGLPGIYSAYADGQKRGFVEIQDLLKGLLKADRELDVFLRDYRQAEDDMRSIREKMKGDGGGPALAVDVQSIVTEFDTVRQMSKMTIGRQGNHFPILTGEYYHSTPGDVGFRENVIARMAWIESIDAEAFCRSYKNRLNRIVPYVILLPNYGDYGVCWEPFDRHNRATSRGRIAVPMYPKNLTIALLYAVADLRWQVAKEKASYYWMEEGLTGNYYQWFQKQKLKGDIKGYFIQDYILWMTKESEGTQKLDKELRGVFWRYMPFSQPIKEKLKGRSFIYQELYQRDLNRAMSDGY